MIVSRRKLHFFSSIALAIVMPIIFIAGLLFRPTYATVTPDTNQLLSHSTEHEIVAQPFTQDPSSQHPISAFLQR